MSSTRPSTRRLVLTIFRDADRHVQSSSLQLLSDCLHATLRGAKFQSPPSNQVQHTVQHADEQRAHFFSCHASLSLSSLLRFASLGGRPVAGGWFNLPNTSWPPSPPHSVMCSQSTRPLVIPPSSCTLQLNRRRSFYTKSPYLPLAPNETVSHRLQRVTSAPRRRPPEARSPRSAGPQSSARISILTESQAWKPLRRLDLFTPSCPPQNEGQGTFPICPVLPSCATYTSLIIAPQPKEPVQRPLAHQVKTK